MEAIQQSLISLVRSTIVEPLKPIHLIDWESLYTLATQQGVTGLAWDGYSRLYEAGLLKEDMPKQIKKQWIAHIYEYERRYASQERVATWMTSVFADHFIRMYILKGFIVSECYPVAAHRRSSDLDCFLVPLKGSFNAHEVGNLAMETKGISVSRRYYKNSSFHVNDVYVENHRFLTPFRGNRTLKELEKLLETIIYEDQGQSVMEGGYCRPPVLATALFLIEHAYSHFLHEGLTLRHILDWMFFAKKHRNDLDWTAFDAACTRFGFDRFFVSYVHLGELILGERAEGELTAVDQMMLQSVWSGLNIPKTLHGVKGKLALVGNTLHAAWKYRHFSPISMPHALWIQVTAFLFDRRPELD